MMFKRQFKTYFGVLCKLLLLIKQTLKKFDAVKLESDCLTLLFSPKTSISCEDIKNSTLFFLHTSSIIKFMENCDSFDTGVLEIRENVKL